MRTIFFCLLLVLGIFVSFGQAKPRMISLDLSGQSPLTIYQNSEIKVSNTFQTNLYDLTITKPPLPKEILAVSEFISGQSFILAFSGVGTYEICFSKEKNAVQTCLNLDVLKRIAA
ncbi:MAG: hypothetical protein H8E42_04520 [Nitrospinae bacterium]|nr:hypothetical protein [Nitrospinota bacterium]MBL7020123.1 hypothetical protein [Nitrospinaceae bacterium]